MEAETPSLGGDDDDFDVDVIDTPLPYVNHTHNSIKVTISPSSPPSTAASSSDDHDDDAAYDDPRIFLKRLHTTISVARALGKSSLWMELPMSRGRLLEVLSQNVPNMHYHHANGTIATLCLWLVEGVTSRIPEYATHQVGVGAVVIRRGGGRRTTGKGRTGEDDIDDCDDDYYNDDDELLVVREARNNYRPWKIPGGLAELGEHIDEAAIREVL
jgi:hypothetical protein